MSLGKPALLFLLVLSLASAYPTFDEYLTQFNKSYSQEEYLIRKQIYDNRIQSFSTITLYEPGVNGLTDMSQDQVKGMTTLQQLPTEAKSSQPKLSSPKLGQAESLDWTTKNAVTSIKNQGSCGCCWAFAAVAYVESKLIIAGQYTTDNIDLSEQYMLQCTKYSNCEGGYLEYALESVRTVPTQEKYPYSPNANKSGICSSSGIRTGYIVQNYYSLTDSEMIQLLQSGPVAISISSQGWLNYGSGIFQCTSNAQVDHAVLLVGYTPTYWIIKNQWGQTWGENGYMRVTRNTARNCRIGTSVHVLWGAFTKVTLVLLGMVLVLL